MIFARCKSCWDTKDVTGTMIYTLCSEPTRNSCKESAGFMLNAGASLNSTADIGSPL